LKLAYEDRKNHGNLKRVGVPAEIWKRNLPNRRTTLPHMPTCRTRFQ